MTDAGPSTGEREPRETSAGWLRSIVLSLLLLGAAAGGVAFILSTEPVAERVESTRKTAMLVETTGVERGTWRPELVATGTVQPERDIVLRSQVGGRIVSLAPEFTPGGFVAAGETLVRIEPDDYEHALAQRRSDLRQARADLAVEEGRRGVARDEYELLGQPLPREQEALVLREPQRDAARSRVMAARAAVAQAELDLARTTVAAPFAAHVLRRDVNVGSRVSPADPLGRLVGLETFWVVVDLPLELLPRVAIPGRNGVAAGEGAPVTVRNRTAWPAGAQRGGRLAGLIGALDERTRMARVLATIPDPLVRAGETDGATTPARTTPSLMIGEFVEVRIEGAPLEDVVRIDRDHLREGDTVWTMEDGRLHIASVDVVLRDAEHAYIRAGLDDGDSVVTTNLATVVEGAPLRLDVGDSGAAGGEGADDAAADGSRDGADGGPTDGAAE